MILRSVQLGGALYPLQTMVVVVGIRYAAVLVFSIEDRCLSRCLRSRKTANERWFDDRLEERSGTLRQWRLPIDHW